MNFLDSVAAVLTGAWLSTVVHEVAHAIAGRLAGYRVEAVGTGAPPLLARVRVAGTWLYVGGGRWLTGRVAFSGAPRSRLGSVLTALAGPAANLSLACALVVLPPDAGLPHAILAGWNLVLFLDNALPVRAHQVGGNDGAHAREALAGDVAVETPATLARGAELDAAVGRSERARDVRFSLAFKLAWMGLPVAAKAALDAAGPLGAAHQAQLPTLHALLALGGGRYDEAATLGRALEARPDATACLGRLILAEALARKDDREGAAALVARAPEAERPDLAHVFDLVFGTRDRDAGRVAEALARGAPLDWEGHGMVAAMHLGLGAREEALRHATQAADDARRLLAAIPPSARAEARAVLVPLCETLRALGLDDNGLADRVEILPDPEDGSPLATLIAVPVGVVCVLSMWIGLLLAWQLGALEAVRQTWGAPVAGLVGAYLLGWSRRPGMPATVRERAPAAVASVVTLATWFAAWASTNA